MTRYRSCEGCSRHVLSTETTCPFCKRELEPAVMRALPKLPAGMSRAQRLMVAAAAVAGQAIAACTTSEVPAPHYGSPAPLAGGGGNGGTDAGHGFVVPVYGAPLAGSFSTVPNGGTGGAANGGTGGSIATGTAGHGMAVPLYGAPVAGHISPTPDAGSAGHAGSAGDGEDAGAADAGGPDGGHIVHPLYGAPLPLYGAPVPAYGAPIPKK